MHSLSSSIRLARRAPFHPALQTRALAAAAPPQRSASRVPVAVALLGAGAFALYLTVPNIPRGAPTSTDLPMSPSHFSPVQLTSKDRLAHHAVLLTLKIPPALLPPAPDATIFSVFVKDTDCQIERAYTPLDGIDDAGNIKLWVKRYEDGEVSRWLCARDVGEHLEIRGPVPTWTGRLGDFDEIIMLSGGTGLTPFYQLLHKLFRDGAQARGLRTHFSLLHSSPTSSTLPPAAMMEQLAHWARRYADKLTLQVFVDVNDHDPRFALSPPALERRIGRADIERCLRARRLSAPSEARRRWPWQTSQPAQKRVLFLVCGPDGMVSALAGPKTLPPGAPYVGGLLGAELGFAQEQVVKL